MGRVYTAVFEGVSVTAVQDFFELTAAATHVIAVHEVHITQDDGETSQQLPVRLIRVPATITPGSGGSTPTARKTQSGDSASAATIKANNTTVATTSGTLEVLRRAGDNVLNGWHWVFLPETRLWLAPSGMLVCRLVTAPAATMPFSGEIVWEECG